VQLDQPEHPPISAFNFWDAFAAELDQWAKAGLNATFWWRDDDTTAPSASLERLLGLSAQNRVPFALAVVPAVLSPDLAPCLWGHKQVTVVQHGFAHVNHAPLGRGLGAWELGLHRPKSRVLAELEQGLTRLSSAFGEQFLPVVAAPWNNIDPRLFPDLVHLGYSGVSASGVRSVSEPVVGLHLCNIHCDVLKWKKDQGFFRGEQKIYRELIAHLHQRREVGSDIAEPTGLVTHHLDFDEPAWRFFARFTATVQAHPAARWLSPREVFPARVPGQGVRT